MSRKTSLGWPACGRNVLISSFLQPFTGGQGQIISLWVEWRHFNSPAERQASLRRAIMCDYKSKGNENQVKETVPTWSQNRLPCNTVMTPRLCCSTWTSGKCNSTAPASWNLASCLHHHNKWLQAYLFHIGLCFIWLPLTPDLFWLLAQPGSGQGCVFTGWETICMFVRQKGDFREAAVSGGVK